MKRYIFCVLLLLLTAFSYSSRSQGSFPSIGGDIIHFTTNATIQEVGNQQIVITTDSEVAGRIIMHYSKCQCVTYTTRQRKHHKMQWVITLPRDKGKEIIRAYANK